MADNLNQVLKDLNQFIEKLVIKLTLDMVQNLVQSNPVDTGWSRSNWIPSIGEPQADAVGSKKSVTMAAQQAGAIEMLGYTLDKGTIFIANNVPYVGILNESHATAQGFVQMSIVKSIMNIGK